MSSSLSRVVRFGPYVAGVVAIWLVSSMPRPPIPEVLEFWNSDKLLHACAYAVLASLALFAVRKAQWAWPMAALYGVVDEVHQSFVPGRSFSYLDMIADALGATVACVVFAVVSARRQSRSS